MYAHRLYYIATEAVLHARAPTCYLYPKLIIITENQMQRLFEKKYGNFRFALFGVIISVVTATTLNTSLAT